MDEKYNRIAGSLIGGAIGDALGYQIEFKKGIKDKEVTRFNDKGIISDDTQMTLFTANALLWRETRGACRGIAMVPADAIYLAYLDWLDTQDGTKRNETPITWIKDIPELNICRAPGMTCMSSLSSGKKGTIEEPINDSKGCGTVMRIAPIGLYAKDSKKAGEVAAYASALTHGHPLGIIPSYVLASMINRLLNDNTDIPTSLNKAIEELKEWNKYDIQYVNSFIELVNKAIELVNQNMNDIEAIKKIGEGWVADEAVAIALYACLKYQNSFEDAIVCAVNHDGDSDSTGAIAGNIIGTYLGLNNIPDYYVNNVELNDVILEIAHDLSIDVPISEYSPNKDPEWEDKYIYCKKKTNIN